MSKLRPTLIDKKIYLKLFSKNFIRGFVFSGLVFIKKKFQVLLKLKLKKTFSSHLALLLLF